MKTKNKIALFFCLTMAVFLNACSSSTSPAEKVAQDFVDAYYKDANLKKAEGLSSGWALDRIRTSLDLREGLSIDERAHRPKIHAKPLDSHVGSEEADFFYEIRFDPDKGDPVRKKTRIKVRLENGAWKVTHFSDQEMSENP